MISEAAAQAIKDWGVRLALLYVLAMPFAWLGIWWAAGRAGRRR